MKPIFVRETFTMFPNIFFSFNSSLGINLLRMRKKTRGFCSRGEWLDSRWINSTLSKIRAKIIVNDKLIQAFE